MDSTLPHPTPMTAATAADATASGWTLFPYALFYRAGFPYSRMEQLRCDATIALFDGLRTLDSELLEMRQHLLRAFPGAVRETARDDHRTRRELSKWRRRVAAYKPVPHDVFDSTAGRPDFARWNTVLATRCDVLRQLAVTFDRETARADDAIRAIARDEHFQEAVFSTNPNLTPGMLESLGRRGSRLNRVVLSYLQRAVAKTDTAGSLGCTNFAELLGGAGATFERTAAASGDTAREVFFSFWAVRSLAHALGRDPAIRPFLRPALRPDVVLQPPLGVRSMLARRRLTLSEREAATIRLVDGNRRVLDIIGVLEQPPDDVWQALEALAAKSVISLDIPVPSTIFHPFRSLLAFVVELPEIVPTRAAWLARLQELDALRGRYRDASLADRIGLLAQLESAFSTLTGVPARRRPGEFYADRCITYEERQAATGNCQFGAQVVDHLEAKLQLPLAVCATYGSVLRRCARGMMRSAYDAYLQERGLQPAARVSFTEVVHKLQAMGRDGAFTAHDDAVAEFEAAWEHIVVRGCDPGGNVSRLTRGDLDPLLRVTADATASAHAAVDILLAARDESDLRRGSFQIIVGEVGENVYVWGSQFYFCPHRHTIESAAATAFGSLPAYRPFAVILAERAHKGFLSEAFPGTIVHAGAGSAQRQRECPDIRDLCLQLVDDQLEVVTEHGGPYQFFHHSDELVHLWAFAPCRIAIPPLRRLQRRPRVEIDGVVLRRQEWAVPKHELLPGHGSDLQRFRHAWTARARLGIPERVFVHVSTEIKPFHIDFGSHESVRLLEHVAAGEQALRFVEMLPGPDEFWLSDDAGRYATEFRLLALRRGA